MGKHREIAALRKEIAALRERVAVLESRDGYVLTGASQGSSQPVYLPSLWPTKTEIICEATGDAGAVTEKPVTPSCTGGETVTHTVPTNPAADK